MPQEPGAPAYSHLRSFWQAKSGKTDDEESSSLSKKVTSPNSKSFQESKDSVIMADLAPSALEFNEEIVGVHLAQFLQAAQQLGGEVAEHARLVQKGFNAQQTFLQVATGCTKPDDGLLQRLLSGTASAISEIQSYRESRRSSPFFNHLSGVSEAIPALAWVTISPTPAPYIKEMNDAGQFYTNRVLKDFKEKPGHSEWVKLWLSTLTALQAYVKKNHTTGLVWGKAPFTGGAFCARGSSGPPPPPPPPAYELEDFQNITVSDERAALFASLNKGEQVTSGLKQVTADMQTHKNPNLRAGSTVPANQHPAPIPIGKAPVPAPNKPPKFLLEGKKWTVEHQIGQKSLTIDKVEMNQVIYMFGCKDSVITVKGKLNSIVIDSCIKTAVVFDSLVSSVEFVNSKDCQMQVMGKVPTITIDKVDGLQIFLSKESLDVEMVSSKSSALNVMVPEGENADYAEWPIPEQFKTVVGAKGLVTTPTETA